MGRPWVHRSRRWSTVVLSVASALLFLGGSVLMNGLVLSSGPLARSPAIQSPAQSPNPSAGAHQPTLWNGGVTPQDVVAAADPPDFCTLPYGVVSLGTLALYCYAYQQGVRDVIGPNAQTTAQDIEIALYNYLNITAAETANWNATSQELLSYFTDRAESIVPYFLGKPWSNVTADEIASYSGLAQATEGVVSAVMEQYWQDWNATLWSFQNAYGKNAEFCNGCGGIGQSEFLATDWNGAGGSATDILEAGNQATGTFTITPPYEIWSAVPYTLYHSGSWGGAPYYMNLEPNGNIFVGDIYNQSAGVYGNWTIHDLTSGLNYTVPHVNYVNFVNDTLPTVQVTDSIAPFDLLEVTCDSNCTNSHQNPLLTSGAYVFESALAPANVSSPSFHQFENSWVDSGTAFIFVNQYFPYGFASSWVTHMVPDSIAGTCIAENTPLISGPGACSTPAVPDGGFATQISNSGPGQAIGGPNTLYSYAHTFQNVINNSLTLAHAYFDVLSAVTNDSEFAIPADCTIPPPTAAFPAATDPSNYALDVNDTTALYVGYLDSVARVFNSTFSEGSGFCGDPNLAFGVHWNTTFRPYLNITASVYLGSPSGPLNPNGTNDTGAVYSTPGTWPVRNIDPAFLYPYLFQMNVPVGTVYAIPANDPIAAMLTDYPGNVLYGTNTSGLKWGIPTYLSLSGYGNFIQISGYSSNRNSGHPLASGDAIYISTCYRGAVLEGSYCPITVTYYNNFTYGIVHAFLYPTCAQVGDCPGPGGGGVGGLGSINDCGFGALNAWYDSWAGYIGSAVAGGFGHLAAGASGIPIIGGGLSFIIKGIGCLLAWIIVILLFALFAYVAVKVGGSIYRSARGRQKAPKENVS